MIYSIIIIFYNIIKEHTESICLHSSSVSILITLLVGLLPFFIIELNSLIEIWKKKKL